MIKYCKTVFAHYEEKTDAVFVNTSYAYRKGRGHGRAIARISDYLARKNKWVCSLDIKSFFDTINRKKLLTLSTGFFQSPEVMHLIEMWVLTGGVYQGKYVTREHGIAQGGVLSPLLSNIYLHGYDAEMLSRKYDNVRYADNILLIAREKEQLLESLNFTKKYLAETLELTLNPFTKEAIPVEESFEFCGIHFVNGMRQITPAKMQSICDKLKETIRQNAFIQIPDVLKEQREGILRYYSGYDTAEQLRKLDEHLTHCLA